MWSDRPPIEDVALVQTASAPSDGAMFHAFARAIARRAAPPFQEADPGSALPQFGEGPRSVLLRLQAGHLVLRGALTDPELASVALRTFLEAVGEAAAAEVGLSLTMSPTSVPVPANLERRWLRLPQTGDLEPRYRAYVSPSGSAAVDFEGWSTPPIALRCMAGHEVTFWVWDPDGEDGVLLIDAAIANMRASGPELLDSATEHVYAYYRDSVADWPAEEREDAGLPAIERAGDVWRHVELDRRPRVEASLDGDSGYLHEGVAYVTFECECAWEPEHGLSLVFIDGCRLGRVSEYDGHPTWAHAYGKRSLLDVIYRSRA